MTDDIFLARIIETPDDDAPRLIYADWLEERGECEYAEFIRVQCELAQIGPPHTEYERLKIRESELLRNFVLPLNAVYRRGMLTEITCSYAELHYDWPPTIEKITLTYPTEPPRTSGIAVTEIRRRFMERLACSR